MPKLKRRERAYYYRRVTVKGGDMIWVRTGLLPSDAEGREYYLSKGFRLTPPSENEFEEPKEVVAVEVVNEKQKEIDRLLKEIETLRLQFKPKIGRPNKS